MIKFEEMQVLYEIESGSYLYGLNTPSSDEDYYGVVIEKDFVDFISLFNNTEEVDLSIKSKNQDGKNDNNAVDKKYFHLHKFIKLCSDCNPNILEMVFAPESSIKICHPLFEKYILNNRELFLSKRLIQKFIGYAVSQEKKSYTKSQNYLYLDKYLKLLKSMHNPKDCILSETYSREELKEMFGEGVEFKTIKHSEINIEEHIVIGELSFPETLGVVEAIQRINDRFSRASHRVDGILVNKYEPKFMHHTVRLLSEGIQLMENKSIKLPFEGEEKELIMSIKMGELPLESIPSIVESYKNKFKNLEDSCDLPSKPKLNLIDSIYVDFIMEYYNFKF